MRFFTSNKKKKRETSLHDNDSSNSNQTLRAYGSPEPRRTPQSSPVQPSPINPSLTQPSPASLSPTRPTPTEGQDITDQPPQVDHQDPLHEHPSSPFSQHQQDSPARPPQSENECPPSDQPTPTGGRSPSYRPPQVEDDDESPPRRPTTAEQNPPSQPTPTAALTKFCATCDEPTGLGCSRCKNISYCSEGCQTADWPVHKLLCWQFDLFQEPERPSPWHIRAVIFPTHSERPRFIWLRMLDRYARDMTMYLGDDNYVEKQGCDNFASRRRPCNSQPLYVYSIHKKTPAYLSRVPNICVPALSDPPGLAPLWRGPVIVAGEYGDVNMRDFRAAVDFLQACPDNMALMDGGRRYQGRAIEAIKVNCDADMATHGAARLQRVQLSEFMLVSCRPTRIRMLFPYLDLVVRIAPVAAGTQRGRNPHCTLMFVFDRLFGGRHNEIFPLAELTEWRTGKYGVGTITIHRDDKKPLLPIHVLAFEDFVYEKAKLVADGQGHVWRGSLMLHLRSEDLAAFWPDFLDRHGLRGGSEEPPSPLDL